MQIDGFCIARLSDLDDTAISEWRALVERRQLNPSLLPEWLRTTVATVGPGLAECHVATRLNADGTMRTIIPFYRNRIRMLGVPLNAIQLASNLVSYHPEIITEGDATQELLAFLQATRPWDTFHAVNVVHTGPTATAIRSAASMLGAIVQEVRGENSPYLAIECDWPTFLGTRSKKFRQKLRQRQKSIADRSRFELRWFQSPSDVKQLLDDMLRVEVNSWKSTQGVAIASRAIEVEYHRQLLPILADRNRLFAAILYLDAEPIAYALCCNSNGWMGLLKTSYDQRYSDLSPGRAALDACIERAFSSGAREMDFLGDADPYKRSWTDSARQHATAVIFAKRILPMVIGTLKRLRSLFSL